MQYRCPNDDTILEHQTAHGGRTLACSQCRGEMINLSVLKRNPALRGAVQAVWEDARQRNSRSKRLCPQCQNEMLRGVIPGRIDKLDVCPLCQSIWFDRGEMDLLPRIEPQEQTVEEVFIPEAQEVFEQIEKQTEMELGKIRREETGQQLSGFKRILALLWLPVREEPADTANIPFISFGVIALMVIAFLMTFRGGGAASGHPGAMFDALFQGPFRTVLAAQHWGFRIDAPLRHGGLTLLSSFFLQINLMHLLYNIAFLKVFGEEVENELGKVGFALMLLAGHIAGLIAFAAFSRSGSHFIIGASSGISAVFAFYAYTFRETRFTVAFWWFFRWYFFSVKAFIYIVPWLIVHVLTTLVQISYARDGAALLFYLGGAAVGLAWAYIRERRYA